MLAQLADEALITVWHQHDPPHAVLLRRLHQARVFHPRPPPSSGPVLEAFQTAVSIE
jgi:hypothetical protein